MADVESISTVMDASMQQIGDVYARAFIAIAQKQSNVDKLIEQFIQFGDVLQAIPKLRMTLESPKVTFESKSKLIDKCLGGRAEKSVGNFVKLLAKRGRFDCYRAVQIALIGLQDKLADRVRADVTSANALTEESKSSLEKQLSNMLAKKVLISQKVDSSIIGGVVVRVGDTVYDASVANRLAQVKSKTVKGISDSIRRSIERFASDY